MPDTNRQLKKLVHFWKKICHFSVKDIGREVLIKVAKISMISKLIGHEKDLYSEMVVESVQAVKMINSMGDEK